MSATLRRVAPHTTHGKVLRSTGSLLLRFRPSNDHDLYRTAIRGDARDVGILQLLDAGRARRSRRSRHVRRHLVAHRKDVMTGALRNLDGTVMRINKLYTVGIPGEIYRLESWRRIGASLLE